MSNTPSTQETTAPQHQERQKVGMLVPPPVLLVALAVLSAAGHVLWSGAFRFSLVRLLLGLFLMVGSVVLIVSCGNFFKKAGTPVRPVSPATTIVSAGPYRFSRNPMYVGMAGLLAGAGVLLASPVFAVAVIAFVAIVHFGVVLPEERYLESLHGQAYLRYKQSVRRWL